MLHRLTLYARRPNPPGIKEEILSYYSNLDLPFDTRKNAEAWTSLQRDLASLRTMPISTAPVPYPTYGDGDEDKNGINNPTPVGAAD